MRKLLVFGGTSAMVHQALRCFAADGDSFLLVGRNGEKLEVIAKDLIAYGAKDAQSLECDLADLKAHEALFEKISKVFDEYDTVLVGYGTLGDQEQSQGDFSIAEREIRTNFLSVVSLLTPIANRFESRRRGTIAVITSVAGDRGRKKLYVYGCAKGALSIFLAGLRNRLFSAGVSVVTVKPGFVDTPMTAHLKKGPLFASAESVGKGIYQAICKKKDVVYLPWFWQGIMLIIKHIPERVFKRLSI